MSFFCAMKRSYKELNRLSSFEERFEYLKLGGTVGKSTFGYDRYLNQRFYTSEEWRQFRRDIILRDNGSDMGLDDGFHEIMGQILIHHINPIIPKDIVHHRLDILLNPDNVVCVSHNTHEAIHYGDIDLLNRYSIVERRPGDTTLWK